MFDGDPEPSHNLFINGDNTMTTIRESEYYISGRHKENILIAGKLGVLSCKKKKLQRIEEYNNNPKLCKECNSSIPYKNRINTFCSSSCSGTYNNKLRDRIPWNEKQRKRVSIACKNNNTHFIQKSFCDVHLITCKACNKQFYVGYLKKARVTCNNIDCINQAKVGMRSYQNSSKKITRFFNPNENREVILESSWEVSVAELLIRCNIKWIRPKFIKWVDSTGKIRRYFPDFYLTDYDVYLDPKNPYCMKLDEEKIQRISEQVTLIVGHIDIIINYVNSLI